ncbi:MAG: RbcX chaperonin protein [Spirulina sp. SIO3F2]|nr:RbcX chaperonin protein [Spirulina sp. SIO3F2]
MNPKLVAQETVKTLQNYLTYQAVREIVAQLAQTNPPQASWLSRYSAGKIQDSEAYLQGLMLEKKELVLRILTVRADIADQIADFLPLMLREAIATSNTDYRRQVLERLTQTSTTPDPPTDPPIASDESDSSD